MMVSKMKANKFLESLVIELDEEDRRVLPSWRIYCVELLNQRIKDILLRYRAKRLGYDDKKSAYSREKSSYP